MNTLATLVPRNQLYRLRRMVNWEPFLLDIEEFKMNHVELQDDSSLPPEKPEKWILVCYYKADKATRSISRVSVGDPVSSLQILSFQYQPPPSLYHCQGCVGYCLSRTNQSFLHFLTLLSSIRRAWLTTTNSNATYPTPHWVPTRQTTGTNIHPCSIFCSHPFHYTDSLICDPLLHPRELSHKMVLRAYLHRPQ